MDGELLRPAGGRRPSPTSCEIALDQSDLAGHVPTRSASAAAGGGPRADLCFAELALRAGDLESAESHGRAALAGFEPGAFNHACASSCWARRPAGRVTARWRRTASETRSRSFARLNDAGGVADALDGLARLAAAAGDDVRAGRLHGAAQRLRETRGRRPIRADLPFPEVPDAARDEGAAMSLDEAVDYALRPR